MLVRCTKSITGKALPVVQLRAGKYLAWHVRDGLDELAEELVEDGAVVRHRIGRGRGAIQELQGKGVAGGNAREPLQQGSRAAAYLLMPHIE